MTTIIDVAKAAGVSKSTVSRVLSNKGYSSKDSKEKVLKAVNELNYAPNYLARDFRNNHSRTIGFLISKSIHLFGTFIEAFITVAEQYDYEIVIYYTNGEAEKEIEYLNLLKYKKVDALFILTRVNNWQLLEEFSQFGPIATWHRIDSDKIYSSYIDHSLIYFELITYLKQQNYTYIGNILSTPNNQNTLASLEAIGHPDNKSCHFWNFFCAEQEGFGEKAALSWLSLKERPTVLLVYSDFVAASFIHTLGKMDKNKLAHLKLISLDNSIIAQLMNITSIDLDVETQAFNSFIYIYNQLNGKKISFQKPRIKLFARESYPIIGVNDFKTIEVHLDGK